jgi:hypothetical protein
MTFLLQPQTEFSTNIWGWLLEIYLWGEPLSPVTLVLWVCFLIASLRCCRKVRGFSLGSCCKAKLLFYIDTWHSGKQVSELFWASVSSLEEWGIWSRLNYLLWLWDGWSDINASYLSYCSFLFSNAGEMNPGLCACWADILPLSYFLSPK